MKKTNKKRLLYHFYLGYLRNFCLILEEKISLSLTYISPFSVKSILYIKNLHKCSKKMQKIQKIS